MMTLADRKYAQQGALSKAGLWPVERVHGESATKLGIFPVSPAGIDVWSTSTAFSASSRTWAIHFVTRLVEALQKLKQSRHRINQRFLSSVAFADA